MVNILLCTEFTPNKIPLTNHCHELVIVKILTLYLGYQKKA